ncbi:MAG: hypothetical protein NVS3B18_09950 [Candidatus Dormibacteria bacterium]
MAPPTARPVLILGLDAARFTPDIRAALASIDCPVLTTYQAKGVLPDSSSAYAGLFTGGTMEQALLSRADVVLGIGLDPVEIIPGQWPGTVPVVLVHSHPVEATYFGDPLVLVGSYARHLPALLGRCRPMWNSGEGASFRRGHLAELTWTGAGLSPQDVVVTANRACPGAVVTVDAGAHMLVVMSLWRADGPDVHISNGLATMGFALPAAIGVGLAEPARRVVCCVGDGGPGMVLAELETLVRRRLDITAIVFNDAALTLIELKQRPGRDPSAVRYQRCDFAAVAEALGCPAVVVEDAASLERVLGNAQPGPLLVDARIDPSGYAVVLRATRG